LDTVKSLGMKRKLGIAAALSVTVLILVFGYLVLHGLRRNSTEGICTVYDDPEGTTSIDNGWSWSHFGWKCTKIYPDGERETFYYFF
jgi:hypothetical protein